MDVTIVNVALPSMKTGLDTSVSWLQWVVDGYTLLFACLLLMAGHLCDQLSAKKLFQWGVIFFSVTSLFCGLANTAWLLTLFRLLQGASAAFIVPASISLIHSSFSDPKSRSHAIGIWGGIAGIAAATGPFLGAVLTSAFSWRAVFFVNVPIGIICFLFAKKSLVNSKIKNNSTTFDLPGQIFCITGIGALAFALIEAGRLGWYSLMVMSSFGLFVLALIAFIVTEWRVKAPMFPLSFFRSRQFTVAAIVGIMMNVGFYGELFILPLYFQHIRGYTVMMTGFAILPIMIMVGLSSYLAGKIVSVIGPKWPMVLGLLLSAIGFLGMLTVGTHEPPYWELILPLMMMGFGVAFTMPAATIAIIRSVDSSRTGIASAAFNTSRQLGSLIGVAIFGTIIASTQNFIFGMHTTLFIAAGVFLFGGFLSAYFIKIKNKEMQ